MKVELGRVFGLCLAVYLVPVLSSSCATGEEDPVFGGSKDGGDSSAGSGFGGSGGATAGVGGTLPGGTGGVFPGGTGGVNPGSGGANPGTGGGTGGDPGTGGTNGLGGTGGGSSGSSGTTGRMCNVAFCPNTGVGMPCCIDPPEDTCGMNNGMGCVKTD